MLSLNPYLYFDGNAAFAMQFYAKCFGGKLELQAYKEAPEMTIPENYKNKIMHAVLYTENITIMAADVLPENKIDFGNNIHMSINCVSESELTKLFFALSEDGNIIRPLHDTFWGARFGQIKDQFGIDWMLTFERI